MAGNSGGPWGGGGNQGGNHGGGNGSRPPSGGGGGRRPEDNQIPEIDELMKKGQEQLRVLMGGRSGGGGTGGAGGGQGGPGISRGMLGLGAVVLLGIWAASSVYTVKPEEQSVELLLGKYSSTGQPGLNFAPWPLVTYEVVDVTSERTEAIGSGRQENGLMLTTDANIVEVDFEVVWNISDPSIYLFNIAEPQQTVRAVSEAVMREVIAASNLAPILNRGRAATAQAAQERIQATLDEYESGINIVRLNLDNVDPPAEVIESFNDVTAAEQERIRLEQEADAYSNRVVAEARGQAAQTREEAEGYRARVVNEARGEAARFTSVQQEYAQAPEVTRRRLYLETMENVLGNVDKTILDPALAGESGGVVPYLPLNQLQRGGN